MQHGRAVAARRTLWMPSKRSTSILASTRQICPDWPETFDPTTIPCATCSAWYRIRKSTRTVTPTNRNPAWHLRHRHRTLYRPWVLMRDTPVPPLLMPMGVLEPPILKERTLVAHQLQSDRHPLQTVVTTTGKERTLVAHRLQSDRHPLQTISTPFFCGGESWRQRLVCS